MSYNVLIVLCGVYACTCMHKEFTRSIRNLHVHVNSEVGMINIVKDHCSEKVRSNHEVPSSIIILFHPLKFRDADKTSHECLNGGFEICYMKFVLTV